MSDLCWPAFWLLGERSWPWPTSTVSGPRRWPAASAAPLRPRRSAHAIPCDVFAPCASARVLHRGSIDELGCALVVGAANDVLADRGCAALLAQRGVTYVPDFVANAGGVLQIHAERAGWDGGRLELALHDVGTRTGELLEEAAAAQALPLQVAEQWASARVGRTVTIPD